MKVSKNQFIGTLIFLLLELLLLAYFNVNWMQCPPCPETLDCPICLSSEQKKAIIGGPFVLMTYLIWIIYKKAQKPKPHH